jgi:Na+/melibiose symporter-like transporter
MSESERNYISVKSWMVMICVTVIPIVGQLMVLVWAFTGENESRKNYFRAILAWMVIVVTAVVALVVLGTVLGGASPLLKHLPPWLHKG